MQEHFRLTPQRVRDLVPSGSIGFYRLGIVKNGQFWPEYCGRSDNGLQSRLLQHARNRKQTHFVPVVTETIRRAYWLECQEFHLHGEKLENEIHPASPNGIAYECQYCGLKDEIAQIAQI